MATTSKSSTTLNMFKVYIFPSLVTVLAMLIWRDISEMRADIKMLLAQSNVDKTKIEILEKTVKSLELTVYNKKIVASTYYPWFMKLYYKPEEVYDINKNIKKEENTL